MSSVWIAIVTIAASPIGPAITNPGGATDSTPDHLVAEVPSFTVRSFAGGPKAMEVAQLCASLRQQIQAKWFDTTTSKLWRPRCEIVLYAAQDEYQRAVGRSAAQTSGSSLIQVEKDRIVTRRIDLLVDQQGRFTALPHELTHVVLAERFGRRQPPRWADEGIATLADSDEKQARHRRDCENALRSGTALQLYDLMTLERFSSSQQVAAFYGQSVSLVRFLSARDEPSKLLPFIELAMDNGYDQALRQIYEIDGVDHLQRLWLDHTLSRRRTPSVPVIEVGAKR